MKTNEAIDLLLIAAAEYAGNTEGGFSEPIKSDMTDEDCKQIAAHDSIDAESVLFIRNLWLAIELMLAEQMKQPATTPHNIYVSAIEINESEARKRIMQETGLLGLTLVHTEPSENDDIDEDGNILKGCDTFIFSAHKADLSEAELLTLETLHDFYTLPELPNLAIIPLDH